jgi:V8-like Glu-specific endopeptidase
MKFSQPKYYLIIGICVLLSVIFLANYSPKVDPQTSTGVVQPNPVPKQDKRAQATVLITGIRSGSASGVIIKSQDKYYVLTNKHVVGTEPGPENKYQVKSYDGKVYQEITANNYNRLVQNGELDLALIELPTESQNKYTAAKLSTGVSESMDVSVSGWPQCEPQPQYTFYDGKISNQLSEKSDIDKLSSDDDLYLQDKDKNYNEGYRLKYTNPTLRGMSGGPVFNRDDNVVAIHGMPGEANKNTPQNCQSLNTQGAGNNWGIPISLFLESNLAQGKKFDPIKAPPPKIAPTPTTSPKNTTSPSDKGIFQCPDRGKQEGWCK